MSEQDTYRTGTCEICHKENVRVHHYQAINKDVCFPCATGLNQTLRERGCMNQTPIHKAVQCEACGATGTAIHYQHELRKWLCLKCYRELSNMTQNYTR